MTKHALSLGAVLVASLLAVSPALAAGAKTYQVTGPVLEVSPTMIVVQKGTDRWEIERNASTAAPADLKVGDKVTIEYRMIAVKALVKPASTTKPKTTKAAK
jgi:hypothetical protein